MDNRNHYIGLVQFFIYAYSVTVFTYMFAGPDLWGHIQFGQDILDSGAIPKTDSFSYTAYGHEWINHEWLSEWVFAALFELGGSPGLILFRLLLGLGIVYLLSRIYFSTSSNWLVYGVCFFLFLNAISRGFLIRPQLFTYFFVPLLLFLLHRYFSGKRGAVWFIPPMMVVWVNAHGGFAAGLGMLGFVTVVESVRRVWTGGRVDWFLPGALGASILAVFANPYGYKLPAFLLETIPRRRDITEWAGVELFSLAHWEFKLLVVLFLISLFSKTRKPVWQVGLIVVSVYFGFKHVRHVVLASMVLVAFMPGYLAALLEPLAGRVAAFSRNLPRWRHGLLMSLILIMGTLELGLDAIKLRDLDFSIQVDAGAYPVHAVQFMKANHIDGNIIVPFNWGEYVIYHRPRSKVSMDGRYWTVYPPKVFKQNLVFEHKMQGWEHYLKLYPHDLVLIYAGHRGLDNRPGWTKLYADSLAALYVRTSDPPHPAYVQSQEQSLDRNLPEPDLRFP